VPSATTEIRLSRFQAFFTGAGLPVFILSVSAVYELFLLAVIFAPPGSGPWSQFSEDFKLWCFRYDPRTGGMSWGSVWVMMLEPLFVSFLAIIFGFRSLFRLREKAVRAGIWRPLTAGAVTALLAASGLFLSSWMAESGSSDILPFPGERIRTEIVPPSFELADQMGLPFSLEEERGGVVLMTGVYAMCATSCPEILRSIRTLLDNLPDGAREHLTVVALSLNPEYETSDLMLASAKGYGFSHPEFRYLNGDPEVMHDLLTRLQFSPVRNPVTRQIDHANLFHLVDKDGRIAYRLTLETRHRTWLRDAILALTTEAAAQPAANLVGLQ